MPHQVLPDGYLHFLVLDAADIDYHLGRKAVTVAQTPPLSATKSQSIHPLAKKLHQIPPIPVLQHRLGLALQLLRADPAGAEGHFLGAGHFQALAFFQRGL